MIRPQRMSNAGGRQGVGKIGFNGVVGGQQRGEESAQYGDGEDCQGKLRGTAQELLESFCR